MRNKFQFLKNASFDYGIVFVIILGIIVRLYAYLKNISFWHDEAALALNIINKNYFELFKGLDYLQVAPPAFLVVSKFLYENIHTNSLFARDLLFRFIPMISGIIAIPLFYKLLKKFTKDKFLQFVGMCFFTFNTTTILYCSQFKQYSPELDIAIILMIIFYKILFEEKYFWYYPLIIAFAPWFSLSSLFIIGSYFFLIVFKNYKLIFKTFTSFFVSFTLFYFFFLKDVSRCNYEGMYNWWQNGYGFAPILHPLRSAIRFGELYSFDKFIALFMGLFVFIITFLSIFPLNKNNINRKLFIYLPIILTYFASLLKLYPIEARLILFLFPLFVIAIITYSFKYKKAILSLICIMGFFTSIYYTINPYRFLTSSRDVVDYVERNLKPDEAIILDSSYQKYFYYIKNKNKVIFLKNDCGEQYTSKCHQEVEELPSGVYYFIFKNSPKENLTNFVTVLDEYNLYSSVVKFAK